ncbi:MAG: ABC transporter permease [Bacteroidetes bacterium]|nr:ABC transporter permease [Bacteroidota bacterium]
MLKNYFVTAWRSLIKNRIYSIINISGLAIGITAVLCILVYVKDELSYDRYHPNSDRIFRVIQGGTGEQSASLPFLAGPSIQNDYPHLVESVVRLFNWQATSLSIMYDRPGDRKIFNEPRFFFADSTFFKVFHFQFIKGDPLTCLDAPDKVVITKSTAKRYFGDDDPIGKILRYEGKQDLAVTGLIEDVPKNSHFIFDFIASFKSLESPTIVKDFPRATIPQRWYWNPVWTYVLLKKKEDALALQKLMPFVVKKYYEPILASQTKYSLQPLTDIYLHSKPLLSEIGPLSSIRYVYIFSIVALSILLVACMNFINLTTARSAERSKEIGVRKVMGALKYNLVLQFIIESMVITLLAALIAIALTVLALPRMGLLVGKELSLTTLLDPTFLILFIVMISLVGLISGIYPAFVLSSQSEVKVLKAKGAGLSGSTYLRKSLVMIQFMVSVILISGSIIVFKQISFMRNADLGFGKEQVLVVPVEKTSIVPKFDIFKEALLLNSNITAITGCHAVIGKDFQTSNYKRPEQHDMVTFPILAARNDFFETMQIKLIAGRSFKKEYTDTSWNVVINRSMLQALGWKNPEDAIHQDLDAALEGRVTIVGVCEDFHYASLKQSVGPLIIVRAKTGSYMETGMTNFLYARVNTGNLHNTISFIEKTWKEFASENAFQFFFLNEQLNNTYKEEETLGKVVTIFSALAIGLGVMGLFGLTAFSVQKRRKEISIRRIVGASSGSIFALLSKDFIILILLSAVVGIPASWFLTREWLTDFAYRAPIGTIAFILSLVIILIVTFLTISYQVFKAARENPTKSLRRE